MKKPVQCHRLDLSYPQFEAMANNISYTSIGKYYVYEKIGEGGFGEVYKGMNDQTKLPVAIKVINIYSIKQEKHQALREIKLKLSKNQDKIMDICDSPYLIKCLDVYENDDLKIIIMEFCNGGTLESYIKDKVKISQQEAILILKQILNGIAELHSHKIIHRDLKAENILLHNNIFKIADFGLSKQLNIANQKEIGKHTFLGTLTTMAPEVMARQKYGLKADIWSVGIIFFQMLFGHYPFNKTTKPQLLQEIKASNLMNKDTLIFGGTKISKQAYDFLKLILVIDHEKRIGWRQLIRHPILNENKSQSKISRFLYDNPQVIMPQNADEQENPQIPFFSSKFRKQTETAKVVKILSNKAKQKQGQMQESQEDKAFKWMNLNIYECLKAELIFQEIIQKIEKQKLLNLGKRQVIELMYLLSTRCFLDLSPIQASMNNYRKKFASYNQIYQTVQKLYSQLKKRWEHYQKLLTISENEILNRIGDFFQSKQTIQKKDKFMNGIENKDYKKIQQLKFIEKEYISLLIKQLRQSAEGKKVGDYLTWYKQINSIQPEVFKREGFDNYIQKLMQR